MDTKVYEIGIMVSLTLFSWMVKVSNLKDVISIIICALIWPLSWIVIIVMGIKIKVDEKNS